MTNTDIDAGSNTSSAQGTSRALEDVLWPEGSTQTVFAVLDGARIPSLLGVLAELAPPSACLFSGKLDPSVARVAPYLVEVQREGPFASWLLERFWGKDAGVFVRSESELDDVRRHLKQFTMARMPDGEQAFFRFYDPRVLRVYLPTCNDEEFVEWYADVLDAFVVEQEGGGEALVFTRTGGAAAASHVVADR